MKKWWMKGLAVALCAGMLAPAAAVSVPGIGMTVYAAKDEAEPKPTEEGNPTEDKITNEKLLSAVNSLKAQKISLQPNEEQAKKLDIKLEEAYKVLGYKDGSCDVDNCQYKSQAEVDAYVGVVKISDE